MDEGRWTMDEARGMSDVGDRRSEIRTDFRPLSSVVPHPSEAVFHLPSIFTLPTTLNVERGILNLQGEKF